MSVVGGRERLALLFLAGVKGGSGLVFQLNTSYMDEDILISANKPPGSSHTLTKYTGNFNVKFNTNAHLILGTSFKQRFHLIRKRTMMRRNDN